MEHEQLRAELLRVLRVHYPGIEVEVGSSDSDPSRLAVRFIEGTFQDLYPQERYHRLVHLIPRELYERDLSNALWIELAPGEAPESLRYPDEELIEDISDHVLGVLTRQRAFEALDDLLCPADPAKTPERCGGDFRHMRRILDGLGHDADAQFDVFHVLMAHGAFCDCEILANAVGGTRMHEGAWREHEK